MKNSSEPLPIPRGGPIYRTISAAQSELSFAGQLVSSTPEGMNGQMNKCIRRLGCDRSVKSTAPKAEATSATKSAMHPRI